MRWFTSVVAAALLTTGLGAAAVPPAHAAASITLDKKAPGSVLLGDPIPYTLTASNPAGNDPLYNVSFSDVLPVGFEYVGPTTPASAGEPTVNGRVLTWNNVTDLQPASSFTIEFKARPIPPAPTTIVPKDANTAYVAGSKNERKVPKFNSNGTPVVDAEVVNANDTAVTDRAPFVVEKTSTNSPEGELLRGVHKQRSTYTLKIRNNKSVATNNVTLTDYLPAQLEFLGCGNVDHSQVVTEEYNGSGPLGTPAVNPDPCPAPTTVETVDSPQNVPGLGDLSGVYTAVTWNVGSLAVGAVKEIKYVAGIPLFENSLSWDSPQVPAIDGPQGSNLDNNNGASTREGIPERSLTNLVSATGTFTGTPTGPATVTERHTVTIEDVRMQKGADTDTFTPGDVVDFEFTIQASEYMSADGIRVTDTLPDGYCPLSLTDNYWPGGPAGCAPGVGPQVSTNGDAEQPLAYASGTQWNAGSSNYTVNLDPVSVLDNKTTTITLPARMLAKYRATDKPTVAGDGFENRVDLTATTTPIQGVSGPTASVGDASKYTQGTPLPRINKQIKPRAAPPDFAGGMKCDPTVLPSYVDNPSPAPNFRNGDVICFKLRVDFPADIETKNAVVTDFPPVDTEFVTTNDPATGNNAYALTSANNVTVSADLTPTKFVLTLGDGGFVPKGGVFEATFAVRVLKPGTGIKPEITGNLMKMRTENTAGVAQSYRDQAEYGLIPPPNLLIDKGVIETNKPAATYPTVGGRLQDNKPIEQGGTATFQIDVRNRPQIPGSDYSVRGVQVWDVLPSQLDCSAIGNLQYIKPGTSTVAALPAGIATCDAGTIKWVFPSPDLANDYSVDVNQTLSLLYTMKVPDEASAGTNYANTSGVRRYEAFTDIPGITATYIPTNNIDPTLNPVADSPQLRDPSNVFIPGVVVAKSGTTSLNETNNNLLTQATIGETITYTYSATIKKGTTVYRGVLSDALPTGIEFVTQQSATLDGGPLPTGFTATDGTLSFRDKWVNDTNADQVFTVVVSAKVGQAAASCSSATCTLPPSVATDVAKENTATFSSWTAESGGTQVSRDAKYTVNVVQPDPRITKTASPTSVTSTATDITYTLTARTPGSRPPLHDVTIVDCIPDTLTVKTVNNGGVLGTNSNCQTTDKVSITWTFDPLAPGTDKVVTYVANIKPGAPADVRFRNTVGMTGTSMPGDVPGERTYLTGANADVFITGASIAKSVTPSVATIGDTLTYSIDTKLPDATYTNLAVADTLPPYIDFADVSDIQIQCFTTDASYQNPVACSEPATATLLGPDPATPGATGQTIAWAFNALPDQTKHRIIRITYKSRVSNVPQNVAGVTRKNTAQAKYGYAQKPATVADVLAGGTTIGSSDATITLTEPNLAITKKVDDQDAVTRLPDDTFTYKVTVSNPQRSGGWGSTAFNVKVRDCVPAGIVVLDPNGGTLGPDNTCASNSAMTWPVFDLAVNTSQEFTYTARLRGDTTTAQTNVASALEWFSLDVSNPDVRQYGPLSADAVVTPVLPDVQIVKKASDVLAYIGQPYTWTIDVTNPSNRTPGPTAYQVAVNDVLPPNWTYKPGTSVITLDGSTVSTAEPTVDATNPLAVKLAWNTGQNLTVNQKLTVTFQALPGADVVTTPGVGISVAHINHATTTWHPGKPADGWGTVTSPEVTAQTAIASGDLQITKSHVTNYAPPLQAEADQVIPGTTFQWRFVVRSNGPDPFVGPYTVTDTLPAGLTYQGYSGTGWSCTPNQQQITCTHANVTGGLAQGQKLDDLFIAVYVQLDAPAEIPNTATVSGKTYDRDPSNNTSTDTVKTRPQADLAIQKSSSGTYVVGEQVEYTLAVTNLGPSTSRKPITVTDTLPSGLSIVSFDAAPWDCSPTGETATFTCVLNQDLLPQIEGEGGQAPLIKILADVVESPGPSAKNCAVVTATTEDQNDENNEDCVTDEVVSEVQLGISKKTTGANPVYAGEKTEFTVTVTNKGPAEAKKVQMQDVLEPGLTATSASGKGWTCDVGTGTIVTCTRKTFPVKDSPSDIVIMADVLASVPGGTTLKNTATVTTTSPQPEGPPAPAESTVDVVAKSDLAIVKTHEGGPWTIGGQGVWQLKVTNNGPSDNPGPLTVVDALPVGNEFVTGGGDGWSCAAVARTVTCERQTGLTVGQSSQFSIRVNVVAGAFPQVVNPAEVTSPLPDTNPDNNRSVDQVAVEKARQTADPLPRDPSVLPARNTKQGQKIHTRVRCTPLKSSAAGETSYCKLKRSKNGTIHIKVVGHRAMRVTVVQFARGTASYKPWKRVKKYVLRP